MLHSGHSNKINIYSIARIKVEKIIYSLKNLFLKY